jgi:hypothetical protein
MLLMIKSPGLLEANEGVANAGAFTKARAANAVPATSASLRVSESAVEFRSDIWLSFLIAYYLFVRN